MKTSPLRFLGGSQATLGRSILALTEATWTRLMTRCVRSWVLEARRYSACARLGSAYTMEL